MTTKSDFPSARRSSVTFNLKDEAFRIRTPSVGRRENQQIRVSSSGKVKTEYAQSDTSSIVSNSLPKKFHKLKGPNRLQQNLDRIKSPSVCVRPQQNVNYENTYRLSPDKNTVFDEIKISTIIERILSDNLKGESYDHDNCLNLCIRLAELIKDEVKATGITRYKLITHVVIFEDKRQGFQYGSRCLWDPNFDNFATASYSGPEYRAVGACFATYYD
ncbi:dynein light chain Tctex-type protein 2B-like [Saccostrea echinata]|uniref:dynein light chain Tctex-type protein 2B-like n=1 Tax=Saccostrea echinata TaxID=191078 RepID=UPI002A81EA1E|nr:dynein light chain Tctex-type protein 2B-like [Saccostrea echinata]